MKKLTIKKINFVCALILFSAYSVCVSASKVISVTPILGNNNKNIMKAIEVARTYKGKPVIIKLIPGIYEFSRSESVEKLYYVSNTTSEGENPNPVKHIALFLEDLKNVTIDGCGSTLLMNGEMTSFVFDNCKNLVFKNINIDNVNPTQTELTVRENGKDYILADVHPSSRYKIDDGKLVWFGEGWSFSDGIAQSYDPVKDVTWRSWSPMNGLKYAVELEKNMLFLKYDTKPDVSRGIVFQMRDAIRDEVCGFVNRSENVRFENVNFYYLGNFGVVCQYSQNVSFLHSNFAPKPGSGRTNAGFADFIQVSGCRGLIDIRDCCFSGAHDDPINIHGTHLKVVDYIDDRTVKVRFMHPQTFGFKAFFKGDEIELVNAETLLSVMGCKIVSSELVSPREMVLRLNKPVLPSLMKIRNLVIENITWTPEVNIVGNRFSRIPTRGILLSTRRKSLIENNVFYGMRMSAILIANDAMSWFESGPVYNLTIRRNTFIDCGGPVINIAPEYRKFEGHVHKNIIIEENVFESIKTSVDAIYARGVNGITIRNNFFDNNKFDKIKLENSFFLQDTTQ